VKVLTVILFGLLGLLVVLCAYAFTSSTIKLPETPIPSGSFVSVSPSADRTETAPSCVLGHAPVKRGQPGYDSRLDRDGDGIACEN
jgi:excalibur calcium-binding domain-containing protein